MVDLGAKPLGERVQIVHEWLVRRAGADRILEALLEMQPGTPVSALVYDRRAFRHTPVAQSPVSTSFIQWLPGGVQHYQRYLPLMPLAVEQFDLSGADTVISIHHSVAKGVLTGAEQLHVSYVQSPMRYAWELSHQYLADAGLQRGIRAWAARLMLYAIRGWDVSAANRVDLYLANSRNAARRIWRAYRRPSRIIYPPVEVDRFMPGVARDGYYLAFSRLVPYKRVDLAVEALSALKRPLLVIGDGPEAARLRSLAGATVTFLGWQPDHIVRQHLERARALIFPGEEDFGIIPVEAQAAGCPVIAFARGGAVETVVDGVTGVFFAEQSPAAVCDAVTRFEQAGPFDAAALRHNAERFSRRRFQAEFAQIMARAQTLRGDPRLLEQELTDAP